MGKAARCAGLDAFFKPRGCAVIGASRDPQKAGHQILRNILDAGFTGGVYPVNPNESEIAGVRCHRSLDEVDGIVELVVISTPSHLVDGVIADLSRRMERVGDVRAVITAAAGFGETGTAEGRNRQDALVGCCRRWGIRQMGPNCVGIIDNVNRLDTTFIMGTRRKPGGISFVSQSGALGAWLVESWSSQPEPAALGKFISLGNMADVEMIEVIEYLGQDADTRVIGLYVEGHPQARSLVEVAGRVARRKPVVVLKVGRTEQGSAAAHSHTGSLAGSDRVYDGAFRQYGILRAGTVEEFSDMLQTFNSAGLPDGNRVFLVTQAGGPGIYCADTLSSFREVEFARIAASTKEALVKALPPFASVCRPEGHADITAAATIEQHCFAVEAVMRDPGVDAVILVTVPTLYLPPPALASALVETLRRLKAEGIEKPFLPVLLSGDWVKEGRMTLERNGVLTFETPDRAARAMAALIRYNNILGRDERGRGSGPVEVRAL